LQGRAALLLLLLWCCQQKVLLLWRLVRQGRQCYRLLRW
jgi:hypothetical protein